MTTTRTRLKGVAAAAALALTLAACDDDEPADAAFVPESSAADDTVAEDPQDTDTTGEDPQDDAAGDDAAVAITAEDGWSDLLDLPLPPPGTAVMTIAGQTYEAEINCTAPGVITDEFGVGGIADDNPARLNEYVLFSYDMNGNGRDADDRPFRISAGRGLFIDGDRFFQIRNSGWGGNGQLDTVNFSNDDGVSRQQTPSSRDPQGTELPLVRVDPSGAMTAQGELRSEFEGDEAPTGPFTLAAQCQETWPEDTLPR